MATAKKEIKIKKYNKWLIIPDDYIPKHIPGTMEYYPAYAVDNQKSAKEPRHYIEVPQFKGGPVKLIHQPEDNPVFRFRQDLPLLDIDYTTMEGKSLLLAAYTAMIPFDDYGYLNNINSISYLITTSKTIVDVQKWVSEIENMRETLQMIMARVEDPDLLRRACDRMAIDTSTIQKIRKKING